MLALHVHALDGYVLQQACMDDISFQSRCMHQPHIRLESDVTIIAPTFACRMCNMTT